MPIELRNRLWNLTQEHIDTFSNQPNREKAIEYIWDRFFKEDIDTLKCTRNYTRSRYSLGQIKERFFKESWNVVYDFLEFVITIHHYDVGKFIKQLGVVFVDERVPYKIIDGVITPLISDEEAAEIEMAIDCKYPLAAKHIKCALELYHKRPKADYKNSIKESISAIEALARELLNKPDATLGALADKLSVHPAYRAAIKQLYGWTSDASGIRHAEKSSKDKVLKIDETEVRFMLVQCSAFINYIIARSE